MQQTSIRNASLHIKFLQHQYIPFRFFFIFVGPIRNLLARIQIRTFQLLQLLIYYLSVANACVGLSWVRWHGIVTPLYRHDR